MSRLRMAVKDALWRLPLRAFDAHRNHRCRGDPRILIVQNAVKQRSITRDFLRWIERHVPVLRARLEFTLLPCQGDWFALPVGGLLGWRHADGLRAVAVSRRLGLFQAMPRAGRRRDQSGHALVQRHQEPPPG